MNKGHLLTFHLSLCVLVEKEQRLGASLWQQQGCCLPPPPCLPTAPAAAQSASMLGKGAASTFLTCLRGMLLGFVKIPVK